MTKIFSTIGKEEEEEGTKRSSDSMGMCLFQIHECHLSLRNVEMSGIETCTNLFL